MITPDQVAACTGAPVSRAVAWCAPLERAMTLFEITKARRQAAFLANVGHETGRLVYLAELWGPTPAQERYEGRADLGNTRPGDGRRFKGRGLLQVTGRANYAKTRDRLRAFVPEAPDFEADPPQLEHPIWAAYSAGLYWHMHSLNETADAGEFDNVCDVINLGHATPREGDSNGYVERLALYRAGLAALGVA